MSTRRARIKAVAALPQRRKNADNAGLKKKQEEIKVLTENELKSSKNCSTSVDKLSGSSTPKASYASPRKSPRSVIRTPDLEKVPSDWKARTPTPVLLEKRSNTPLRDKTDTNKPAAWRSDVFVSPQARASPLRRFSPVVKAPVIEVDVGPERNITPHKKLLELQDDANKNSKVSESRENAVSLKQQCDVISVNSNTENTNILDNYNSPNTPETSDIMDGIVPLKPVSNAPKPIDLLKSEIISENAEVLFDPIVPLPSPTKVRQKLRPVPRLGPMRRNSIPGSASESEDESRRAFHGGSSTPSRQRHDSHTSHSTLHSLTNRDVSRVRNDSVCSSVSQLAQTPAGMGSPLKERNVSRSRRQEVSRRMAAMRRRKESVQRDKLTMFDLIFYNPLTKPIVPDQDEIKAKEATKKEEEQRKVESKMEEADEDTNEATTDSAPVPQIKLGPNGEIMLDEQSLVIKQSEQRKLSDSVVHEGAWMSASGRVYRRTQRTAEWTDAETVRFYRALAVFGTDFSLMVQLFPKRSRRDLKLKFKKEERANLARIDKALRTVAGVDANQLEAEFEEERRLADEKGMKLQEQLKKEKKAEKERYQTMKERKVRKSKGSRALGTSIMPTSSAKSISGTANDFLVKAVNAKLKRQRELKELKEQRQRDGISEEGYATLSQIRKTPKSLPKVGIPRLDLATIQRTKPLISPLKSILHQSPVVINAVPTVPADIAPGSLVVLTVDDPKAPSQKAIHTYIKQADGSIASIILDPSVMSSLVHYVKNDTPKAGTSSSTISPSSFVSDRMNTPTVSGSPNKRKRLTSYTITEL